MFGTIKENILNNLEETYTKKGENVFKKQFNRYFKTIKENADLKEFYEIYDLFNQVNFDDIDVAKEFIEESVKYLKSLDKNQIDKLTSLAESTNKIPENTIEFKLDQIIFNESISLKEKAQLKVDLMRQITKKDEKKIDFKDKFDKSQNKINENVAKLSEEQNKILELFIENDHEKINKFYLDLITETESIVENNIINAENPEIIKKLVEVKKRLNQLKSEPAIIDEVEKIIDLKESFS